MLATLDVVHASISRLQTRTEAVLTRNDAVHARKSFMHVC